MKRKEAHVEMVVREVGPHVQSALDLWRLMGGESHRVRENGKMAPDSMLAVYKERVTYTFIMDDEVSSIHFDRKRGEIFFRGHNITHMDLTEAQKGALLHMKQVLAEDEKAKSLLPHYSATLDRLLADK